MSNKCKIEEITIETPIGTKKLKFIDPGLKNSPQDICCERICYMWEICSLIRDPRNPEDHKIKFDKFCDTIEDKIPALGTADEVLKILFEYDTSKLPRKNKGIKRLVEKITKNQIKGD